MKKIILIGMMVLGITIFAEKLNTDGKEHLKELLGKWGEPQSVYIVLKNNKLFYVDEEGNYNPISKINEYTFKITFIEDNFNLCFAYDIKQKKLAFLKKCGTSEIQQYIPKKYKIMGG